MHGLIEELINSGYLKTKSITDAFLKIDRKDFVPEELATAAYENHPLPIGHGQTISQPLTVAFMLELLEPKAEQKILDIGSGSGWTTALLSHIIGENGQVIALEIVEELAAAGKKNCEKYGFVSAGIAEFHQTDGNSGFPEKAPYDRILVSAAADKIPQALKDQLKTGGRLVIPVDNSIFLIIKKENNKFSEKEFPGFVFVPLISK